MGEKNETFGYGYDFRMYCVGRKEIDHGVLCSEKLICATVPFSDSIDGFAFPVCDGCGVFCDFISRKLEIGGTVFIREADSASGDYFNVPWRDESELRDVRHVTVDDDFKDEIVKAMYDVIDLSPVRKAYLQIRCQCREKDNIIGMLTCEQMEKLIREDKLCGNLVYVIYDPLRKKEMVLSE